MLFKIYSSKQNLTQRKLNMFALILKAVEIATTVKTITDWIDEN